MSRIMVSAENLGKRYSLGETAPYQRLSEVLQRPLGWFFSATRRKSDGSPAGPAADRPSDFWALRDVSFEVPEGTVLGIIGKNGAGKSTLLKILARIVEPTTGRIGIRGRLGSLLEVGTGFHPELTGRENVYLSGTVLGMSRREIQRHFDEIVAFAEVEKFIDLPVKHYSSGMYVRLGFAIAAHLKPDVLVIDEVLAVGDAAFQKKCLGKLDEAAREQRTVLFVSHNMAAIQRLCTQALLLEGGRISQLGDSQSVVEAYLNRSAGQAPQWRRTEPPPDHPHFRQIFLCDVDGRPCANPASSDKFGVAVEYCFPHRVENVLMGLVVCSQDGTPLFSTVPQDSGRQLPPEPGVYRTRVLFPKALLMPNRYSLMFGIYKPHNSFERLEHVIVFDVIENASLANELGHRRMGELQISCDWKTIDSVSPTSENVDSVSLSCHAEN